VLLLVLVFCVVFKYFVIRRSMTCAQCCMCRWIVKYWLPLWAALLKNAINIWQSTFSTNTALR
jgi:hypothetical protein